MLSTLLTTVGLPALTRLVSGGLSGIDNPAAKAASSALDEAGKAFERKEVTPEQLAAANDHMRRMAELDVERETVVLEQINRTMRAEVKSDDPYVRRWRPTFGYAVAITWMVQMAGLTYAIVATPEIAGEILAAMTHLTAIWGVALSVLGINVAKRSQDKAVDKGEMPKPGLLERLAAPLTGGRRE